MHACCDVVCVCVCWEKGLDYFGDLRKLWGLGKNERSVSEMRRICTKDPHGTAVVVVTVISAAINFPHCLCGHLVGVLVSV